MWPYDRLMQTAPTANATAGNGATYLIHTRSQHSVGSSSHRFGGPDTYVAVTVAPAGVAVPYTLRRDVLAKRGIQLIYCGEGCSRNCGQRSMLGKAVTKAQSIVAAAGVTRG